MTLLKLIIQYLTNRKFRNYIDGIMALANNQNGIADEVDRQIEEFKDKTYKRLNNRVNELTDVISLVRPLPGSSIIVSKLNYLLNELKDDLKSLD